MLIPMTHLLPVRLLRHTIALLTASLLCVSAGAMPLVSAEAALLALINDARGQLGASALTLNDRMRDAALAAAQDMAAHAITGPVGSDGRTVLDRLGDAGYTAATFQPVGLVGVGGADGSAPVLLDLWLADTTSRAALTATSATEIGVGLSFDSASRSYWSLVINPVVPADNGGNDTPPPLPGLDPTACAAGLATLDRAQCLLNDLRLRQGLQRLALDGALTDAGQAHSLDMLTHDFLGFLGSDGSDLTQRTAQAGYDGAVLGQLVADGFAGVDAVLGAWLDGAASRDVLLNPLANEFGLGLQGSWRDSRWTLFTGQAHDTAADLPEPAAPGLALLALAALGAVQARRRATPIYLPTPRT
jgi:uncharacterized protein YkwD